MIRVITTSAASLRSSRKGIVLAALRRWVDSAKDTPDEGEGVDLLVKSDARGIAQAYRQLIQGTNGSVPRLGERLFSEDERNSLDSIARELWSRTDKSSPPKGGVEFGVKLLLRTVTSKLFAFRDVNSFPESDDAAACFGESLSLGLPKVHTPKGSVSTSDAVSFIESLLNAIRV